MDIYEAGSLLEDDRVVLADVRGLRSETVRSFEGMVGEVVCLGLHHREPEVCVRFDQPGGGKALTWWFHPSRLEREP